MAAIAQEREASFQVIALEHIKESSTNPRRHFDKKALDELTESVKSKGIIQPVLVRPNGKGFELVAGSRRLRAAKSAGLRSIPATIKDLTDAETIELQVIENLQREDVHPIEEAQGYKALLATTDYASLETKARMELLAGKVGKSVSYVYQRLKLLDLSAEAQKEFLDGNITAGHAVMIARLTSDGQADAITWLLYETNWNSDKRGKRKPGPTQESVRALADYISKSIHRILANATFDIRDKTLLVKAGSCMDCPKRTGHDASLFGETNEKDRCLDRQCFSNKTQTHITKSIKALEDDGFTVHPLTTDYWTQGKYAGRPLIGRQDYNQSKEETGLKGIMVESRHGDGLPIGTVINIKLVGHAAKKVDPAAERANQDRRDKLAKRKSAVMKEYKTTLFQKLKKKCPKKIDLAALRLWVTAIADDRYKAREICRVYKWGSGRQLETNEKAMEVVRENVKSLSESQIGELFFTILIADEADTRKMEAWADQLGIDAKAIKHAIEAKHPKPEPLTPKKKADPKKNGKLQTSATKTKAKKKPGAKSKAKPAGKKKGAKAKR